MAVPFLEFTATPNRRFKFSESRQLLIRIYNETLSVVAGREAILWVRPLAATPRIARRAATAEMMSDSDCAQVFGSKDWCLIG